MEGEEESPGNSRKYSSSKLKLELNNNLYMMQNEDEWDYNNMSMQEKDESKE